ncbi:helix-turn-helix domain-containing protein [Brevibacillus sp. HD1.4A]|uniref:winged helix-turn-helix transcriptional regulator n=1 Tax=Brevibacillus sp. HD1.4A TaxID=2738978 RepID=UPI00156B6FC5|nr:helix-turn-helix domain-containing protein [Brevibacillus sp. HD1.4A]NRQ52879.1 helix-turn-helix transcriptional regulator [Brevibacillus sp. HD1.4A]
MTKKKYLNEFDATLQIIQGKWKVMILYELYENSPRRFGELHRYIRDISHKTLTNQLRELEEDGLVIRTVYPEVPPRVEYTLTAKGLSLIPLLEMICDWGIAHVDHGQMERLLCDETEEK